MSLFNKKPTVDGIIASFQATIDALDEVHEHAVAEEARLKQELSDTQREAHRSLVIGDKLRGVFSD
jgi:hypothetical protein